MPRPQPQRVHSGHGGHGSDAAGYQAARFCRFVTENEIQIIENFENSISCIMSGGYSYKNDTDSSILANRTLYWRTHGDSLELTEVSLNFDLVGNRVKYRFVDTPLLPGISVHESWGSVVVLVPTVGSVHKLCFPHPAKLEGRGRGGDVISVLAEAGVNTARECQHILSWPASSALPSIASTHFTNDEVRNRPYY